MVNNILVGVDFKESSKPIIEMATYMAEKHNAKVWLVHIATPEPEYVGYSVGPQYIRDNRAEELKDEHRQLEQLTSDFHYRHLKAEGLLIQGGTVRMILDESEKLGIDLVILGHHKHNIFFKTFVGCTDSEVIQHSKIPVLIVPLNG